MANKKKTLYQYGICTNKGKCSMADTKETQQIPVSKPFVCTNPDCCKPLVRVSAPKQGPNLKAIIFGSIGGLALVAGAFFLFFNGDKKEEVPETEVQEQVVTEPEVQAPEVEEIVAETDQNAEATNEAAVKEETKKEPQSSGAQSNSNSKTYAWGTYKGDLRNGKADGVGILEYTQQHTIMRGKDYVAEPGDRVQGTFFNDEPANVTWYSKDGVEKGVLKK